MSVNLANLTALADGLREKSRAQPHRRKWWDIKNVGTSTTAIYIYDMIGEWGVTAADFVNELLNVNTPNIEVHLNSEGGEVFDGIAIYTALVEHPSTIHTVVDGLAASAASFIFQAGETRKMAKRSRLMIHNAQGICMGDEVDGEEFVRMLKDLSDNIADIYAERSGQGDREHWRKQMSANRTSGTWYSASEAVDAGLADEVLGETSNRASNIVPSSTSATPKFPVESATSVSPVAALPTEKSDDVDLMEIFRVFQEV